MPPGHVGGAGVAAAVLSHVVVEEALGKQHRRLEIADEVAEDQDDGYGLDLDYVQHVYSSFKRRRRRLLTYMSDKYYTIRAAVKQF